MDFETTFFGQLKKPCYALGFWDFAFQEMVILLYKFILSQLLPGLISGRSNFKKILG